jgi:hypothetical protein
MRVVTIERGREVEAKRAQALRIEVSYAVRAGTILAEQERQLRRPVDAPERASVRRAMEAVEGQIVRALWTLARLPDRNPFGNGRCGLDYVQDREERFANAVANGGKWDHARPKPPLPSSRAIDAMDGPLEWLSYLSREHAKLVSTAAATKRGDPARSVSWARVRDSLPDARTLTIRTLQRRYEDGIRIILGHLSTQQMEVN